MAEIKNWTDQIEVVGVDAGFEHNIIFHNKRDTNGKIILGVKLQDGYVVLFSANNGRETEVIHRFKYSFITSPTSTSPADLVEQINTFISSSPELVMVNSVFSRTGDVVAESGDYNASKVLNDSSVSGTTVKDALNNLNTVTPDLIGGLVVTSTATTNVSNGAYNVLEDDTALTSVSYGITQDSNWTIEITEPGIISQKGRVSAVIKCEKTGGGGKRYDFAIFKNGSILSDSEMTDLTLENNDTWGNIKCTSPVEISTGDLFSLRVSGNGTGDDIECTNGTIYIE